MAELLTRDTARERTHEARLAGTLIDFALILQAEALEWAAKLLEPQSAGAALEQIRCEAARLRKEAQ